MAHTVPVEFKQKKNAQANQPLNLYILYDYDGTKVSGSATSTSANHLVDTAASFSLSDVGKTIHNTTDGTFALITAFNTSNDVTLSADIMTSGEAYDMERNLYLSESAADVVYNGMTYTAFPIAVEPISESTSGEIDAIRVKVGNAGRVLQYYIETYELRGKKLGIKMVWADALADLDNYIEYIFYIDKYDMSALQIIFTCSSKFDILDVELPFGKYMRGVCRWIYKSSECGYVGGLTTCNRTMADCRVHLNILRFGAFPSIPMQRTYLG